MAARKILRHIPQQARPPGHPPSTLHGHLRVEQIVVRAFVMMMTLPVVMSAIICICGIIVPAMLPLLLMMHEGFALEEEELQIEAVEGRHGHEIGRARRSWRRRLAHVATVGSFVPVLGYHQLGRPPHGIGFVDDATLRLCPQAADGPGNMELQALQPLIERAGAGRGPGDAMAMTLSKSHS